MDKENLRAEPPSTGSEAGPARLGPPETPKIENIHQRLFEAVSQPNALDMGTWHCGTAHCRAGHVVNLAGEAGYALEKFFNTELAAMKIYAASGFFINPARFYDDAPSALADMKRLAEEEKAATT